MAMDARTAEALEKSIAHWEKNARAKKLADASIGGSECALCDLFNTVSNRCAGCPVSNRTGRRGCGGTPYVNAFSAKLRWASNALDTRVAGDSFRAAAQAEVDFLKSLREPKDEGQ